MAILSTYFGSPGIHLKDKKRRVKTEQLGNRFVDWASGVEFQVQGFEFGVYTGKGLRVQGVWVPRET